MPRTRRIALDVVGLIHGSSLLRLTGGRPRDTQVDCWLSEGPIELRSIARHWFQRMRQCGEDVRELIHDGCPVACVHDAPFGYVNTFKSHVNVGFFYGAALQDPGALLEGGGKRMRHVKLKPGMEFNAAALGNLIASAYSDIRMRLGDA